MNTPKKSKTLWAAHIRLRQAMVAPTVTPERKAELEPVALKLKQAAQKAEISERAQKAIDDIHLLQKHTARTGFRTTRGQNDILATLNGPDLAAVLSVVTVGGPRG